MIIQKHKDFHNSYYVSSADWEALVSSSSFDEAVSIGLEEAFGEYGENLNLSPAIICIDLTNFSENFDENNYKIYSTIMILSNIGRHDLAKKLKVILNTK